MQKIKTAESLMALTHTQVYLNNIKNNLTNINETRLNL